MTAQQLKNSILQMAVQGKLVPQDPNDEPASVLLERIRAEKERLIKEKKIKREKNPSVIFKGADFLIRSIIGTFEIPTPPVAALTQASHFDVKILLAGVNPSPPCRPRAGTSRQHCRKVSVKIGFGNMAEPDHSGLP